MTGWPAPRLGIPGRVVRCRTPPPGLARGGPPAPAPHSALAKRAELEGRGGHPARDGPARCHTVVEARGLWRSAALAFRGVWGPGSGSFWGLPSSCGPPSGREAGVIPRGSVGPLPVSHNPMSSPPLLLVQWPCAVPRHLVGLREEGACGPHVWPASCASFLLSFPADRSHQRPVNSS